jgi:hypothetical protein
MSNGKNTQSDPLAYEFSSGEPFRLIHRIPTLQIRLAINPSEAASADDKFTLKSTDGTYEKVMTVKDDSVPGDEFTDLIFENLKTTLNYTLEVDPGKEGSPYKVFENVPFQDLVEFYAVVEAEDELEEKSQQPPAAQSTDWEDEGTGASEWGGDADDEAAIDKDEVPEGSVVVDWNTVDPERPLD